MQDSKIYSPELKEWECAEFTEDGLEIKLEFNNFAYISHKKYDTLLVKVVDNTYFELKDFSSGKRLLASEYDSKYIEEGFTF